MTPSTRVVDLFRVFRYVPTYVQSNHNITYSVAHYSILRHKVTLIATTWDI